MDAPKLQLFDNILSNGIDKSEYLLCYEIDAHQAKRIEPNAEFFLGGHLFSGKKENGQGTVILPAGIYLFSQQRKTLNSKECIEMAIEQQKDGLWERFKLEPRLYIRFLHEDNSPVTQVFRPVII
ncbi:MAG: hypothetical protein FWH41_05610 [Treponema sp.]|nr:hypothetical protein [Treponema sp.]